MANRAVRPFRIGAAGVAAVLLLAACGGGKTSASTTSGPNTASQAHLVSLLQSASGNTEAEKTATVSGTVSSQGGEAPLAITLNGGINFVSHQTQFTMDMAELGTVTTVFDDGVIYEKIPDLAGMPGGKPWVKLDLKSLAQDGGPLGALGQMLQQGMDSQQSDPSHALDFLDGVTGTVTTVGTETIDGVPTTHYRFPVDVHKAIQRLGTDQSDFQQFIEGMGIENPVVDVWLDGQGLVRLFHTHEAINPKPTASSPLGIPGGALPSGVDLTFAFSNFGAPVTITVPPASQVTDLAGMLKGMGNLGNLLGGPDTSASTAA